MNVIFGYFDLLIFSTGVVFGMCVMAIISRWYIETHSGVSERMAESIDRFNESIGKMQTYVDDGRNGRPWHEEQEEQDEEFVTGPARA